MPAEPVESDVGGAEDHEGEERPAAVRIPVRRDAFGNVVEWTDAATDEARTHWDPAYWRPV